LVGQWGQGGNNLNILDYQPAPTNMKHLHHIIPKHMGGTAAKNRRSYEGDSNPFYGKSQTPEARESISKTLKEHYKQEGHPWTGRKHSEETKEKFKKRIPWNKGKKMTDEHKKSISEGRRRK